MGQRYNRNAMLRNTSILQHINSWLNSKHMGLKENLYATYSANLELVVKHLFPEKYEVIKGKYLCPICLDVFSMQDLEVNNNGNYLTEEHVPPQSVQWKRKVLTCKTCNTIQGGRVDSHQPRILNTKAFNSGISGTSKNIRITFGSNLSINGTLTIKEDGKLSFVIDDKRSNPSHVTKFNGAVKSGSLAGSEAKWDTGDKKKAIISIIRAAYLWGFADLGYAFIFNPHFSKIREQLLFPDRDVYWQQNIIQSPTAFHDEGIHVVAHPDDLGISAVVMNLTASGFTDQVCVLLPGADSQGVNRLNTFKKSLKHAEFELIPLQEIMNPQLLSDAEECITPYMFWLVKYESSANET